jgi:hypothetical protein
MLRRLVELKEEVKLYLKEENPTLADLFHNEIWLRNFSYITDDRENLNGINISLQAKNKMYYFRMIK